METAAESKKEQLIFYGIFKESEMKDYQQKTMTWVPQEHRKSKRAKLK